MPAPSVVTRARIRFEASPGHPSLGDTRLHARTEGIGAYVLGRQVGEVPDALNGRADLAEVEARHSEARWIHRSEPVVSPARYRSPARRGGVPCGHWRAAAGE